MKVGTHTITCTATGGNDMTANAQKSLVVKYKCADGTVCLVKRVTCSGTFSASNSCVAGSGVTNVTLEFWNGSNFEYQPDGYGGVMWDYNNSYCYVGDTRYDYNFWKVRMRCAGVNSSGVKVYSNYDTAECDSGYPGSWCT